ncbi:MAG TPA: metallophosphoesterase [Kofleriaceae bacterium]|nr:metallophosphoesterase [Kofleriaceae bacterium]
MRRRFQTALLVYTAAHLYIWWRLIWPLPSPWWQIATVALPFIAATFPVGMVRTRRLPMPRQVRQRWLLPGYLWFGFATYLLLGAIASHIAVAFGTEAVRAAQICSAVSIVVVIAGLLNVARGPTVKRVRIPMRGLPVEQYTVVHLTDVHIGSLIGKDFAEQLVERVNALRADLIVITGDLVDGNLAELRPHIDPLRGLRARDGVYSVTGNHEYYWNVEPWMLHLRSLGIEILRNERRTIANTLELAGTDDSSATEDVPRAVAGRDPNLPLVLLAHHPRTVKRAMAAGVDLQLSGHTHGGQMLPWGYLARLWDPKVSGLARFDRTWLYVSQGTGYWGPPIRIGTSCEIAAITLVPEAG